MNIELQKPIVGFTCGDLNGIGIELIIQSLHDNRILDIVYQTSILYLAIVKILIS